jgi:hypothetical protein
VRLFFVRLVQDRFLRKAEKIAWRPTVPKGRHESSPGRQVLGRASWTGVESRQGRLRACVRSRAKDLFPRREPGWTQPSLRDCVGFSQIYPALRTGLLSGVPANAGTHNSRGHRNHLDSILGTTRFGDARLSIRLSNEIKRQTASYALIWAALILSAPARNGRNHRTFPYWDIGSYFRPRSSAAMQSDQCAGRPDWRCGRHARRRCRLRPVRSALCAF